MVSEKVIVILIVIAILLSVVSIVVTISSVNTKMLPEIKPRDVLKPDVTGAKVSIIIQNPAAPA